MTRPLTETGIPTAPFHPGRWLDANWPYAGAVRAAFLALLLPLILNTWRPELVLLCLLNTAYLVHQVEEHHRDRFRRFVNLHVAGGANALTPRAVTVVNVGLVWLLFMLALLAAGLLDVGYGLAIVYTSLLNAVVHVVGAVALRRYNPGLVTAVLLFIPLGVLALIRVSSASGLGATGQVIGVVVAVLGHAAILVEVRRRLAYIRHASTP